MKSGNSPKPFSSALKYLFLIVFFLHFNYSTTKMLPEDIKKLRTTQKMEVIQNKCWKMQMKLYNKFAYPD